MGKTAKSPSHWFYFFVGLPFGAVTIWLLARAYERWGAGDSNAALGFAGGAGILGVPAVAFGLLALAQRAENRRRAEVEQLRSAHPDRPWMWEPEWASGRLDDTGPRWAYAVAWGFALFWLAVSCGALWLVVRNEGWSGEPGAIASCGLFIAVGLGLVGLVLRATLRHRKFGRSIFDLASLPAPLGGELEGALQLPAGVLPGTELKVRLECFRRSSVGSRTSHLRRLWWNERRITAPGVAVPIALTVPYDLPATTLSLFEGGARVYWRLTFTAPVAGIDYRSSFEVPVFQTAESDPTLVQETVGGDLDPAPTGPPAGGRFRIEIAGDGTTSIRLPAPGWVPWWIGLSLLPLLASWPASRLGDLRTVPFWQVFGVSTLIFFGIGGITLLGLVMQPSRLELGSGRVRVRRGWGPFSWHKEISRSEIVGARHDPGAAQGSRPSVDLVGEAGRSWTVALGIRELEDAKWLAAQLRQRLGVGTGSETAADR